MNIILFTLYLVPSYLLNSLFKYLFFVIIFLFIPFYCCIHSYEFWGSLIFSEIDEVFDSDGIYDEDSAMERLFHNKSLRNISLPDAISMKAQLTDGLSEFEMLARAGKLLTPSLP